MQSSMLSRSAVIVDDEPLPRAHLNYLLSEAGVGKVSQVGSALECLRLFETEANPPDWVFIDIQMPGMDGLSLADALVSSCAGKTVPSIVFVTGFGEYAVEAFERAALDYLLKPVVRDRLDITLARLAARHTSDSLPLPERAPIPIPALQRLPIRLDYAVRLVDVDDIIAATSRQKRVEVITADTVYSTYYTLNQLEQRLPADRFLRVHESWIVSLAQVLEIHNLGSQSYQLRLQTGERMIPISRRRLSVLQTRLGL